MPDDRSGQTIAVLSEEIDEIHRANGLYWSLGQHQTKAAKARYQFRQDRLEEIRQEWARLRDPVAARPSAPLESIPIQTAPLRTSLVSPGRGREVGLRPDSAGVAVGAADLG